MSQRNSGYERKKLDAYATPSWVTKTLIGFIVARPRGGRDRHGYQQAGPADPGVGLGCYTTLQERRPAAHQENDAHQARSPQPKSRPNGLVPSRMGMSLPVGTKKSRTIDCPSWGQSHRNLTTLCRPESHRPRTGSRRSRRRALHAWHRSPPLQHGGGHPQCPITAACGSRPRNSFSAHGHTCFARRVLSSEKLSMGSDHDRETVSRRLVSRRAI